MLTIQSLREEKDRILAALDNTDDADRGKTGDDEPRRKRRRMAKVRLGLGRKLLCCYSFFNSTCLQRWWLIVATVRTPPYNTFYS